MSERHFGGCLCGAIRYEISGPLRPVINCHCRMCREFSRAVYNRNRPGSSRVMMESVCGSEQQCRLAIRPDHLRVGKPRAVESHGLGVRDQLSVVDPRGKYDSELHASFGHGSLLRQTVASQVCSAHGAPVGR